MESTGNMRNKILKYGANTLQIGQLCLGYITGISKAGCFVKIGLNTVGRAPL
jgi:ribosomal protein S1